MTTPMRPDEELKALPHMEWRTILTEKPEEGQPGLSDDDREIMDKQFYSYVQVPIVEKDGQRTIESCDCVACGNTLGGTDILKRFLSEGGFEWGIAHGEGHCRYCGWPCTAHHEVRRPDGTVMFHLRNFIMQYHPEYVQCEAVRHRMLAKETGDGA